MRPSNLKKSKTPRCRPVKTSRGVTRNGEKWRETTRTRLAWRGQGRRRVSRVDRQVYRHFFDFEWMWDDRLGRTCIAKHWIKLVLEDASHAALYREGTKERVFEERETQKILSEEVIEQDQTERAEPIVFAAKKDSFPTLSGRLPKFKRCYKAGLVLSITYEHMYLFSCRRGRFLYARWEQLIMKTRAQKRESTQNCLWLTPRTLPLCVHVMWLKKYSEYVPPNDVCSAFINEVAVWTGVSPQYFRSLLMCSLVSRLCYSFPTISCVYGAILTLKKSFIKAIDQLGYLTHLGR